MVANENTPIIRGTRDGRFQRELERVMTLPGRAERERFPVPLGLVPQVDGLHPIACVYIYEDGSGLWLHQDWPIGAEAFRQVQEMNGQLNGGLVAGMRVRADRDDALEDPDAARYWRRLADYVVSYDDCFDDAHYDVLYREQLARFEHDERQ